MKYTCKGKTYEVDSINYGGEVVNVDGYSITLEGNDTCTVFCDGDEVFFETFNDAYEFIKGLDIV